jgi:palmitoyltransferase
MAVTTGPGFAKDVRFPQCEPAICVFAKIWRARQYVPQSDPPREKVALVQVEGYRFEDTPQGEKSFEPPPRATRGGPVESTEDAIAEEHPSAGAFGPGATSVVASAATPNDTPSALPAPSRPVSASETTAVSSTSLPYPAQAKMNAPKEGHLSQSSTARSYINFPPPPEGWEPAGPKLLVDRIPPDVPVLTEEYRYDSREGFLRPYRSHRCKHCAKVVLSSFLSFAGFLIFDLTRKNDRDGSSLCVHGLLRRFSKL